MPLSDDCAVSIRLRLDVSYDGTAFHGWAKQPNLRTVQGELEAAIGMALRVSEADAIPQLTVAGRTDAGVHARGQVAHLDVSGMGDQNAVEALSARRLGSILKSASPDLIIRNVMVAPPGFDARFSAMWRRYEYRIADGRTPGDPLSRMYTAHTSHELNDELLHMASAQLIGLRDFTTFCKAREGATAVRTLQTFEWQRDARGALVASIQADAFCHSMVRALVGGAVAVATGRLSPAEFMDLADARARTSRFTVMPAHGLSLEEVGYPPEGELAARAELTRARREKLE